MSTRAGWTFNGHHYTECASQRMGRPLFTFHRNGVRMSEREWRKAMAEDKAQENQRSATQDEKPRT